MSNSKNIKLMKNLMEIAADSLYFADKDMQISRRGSYDCFARDDPSCIFAHSQTGHGSVLFDLNILTWSNADANLNAEEAERAVAINNEMAKLIRDYREYIVSQINEYQANYRVSMSNLLESFDRGIASEDDLDSAVYAIIDYAEETGLALQHTDFDDFSDAMMSDKPFSL